MITCVLILVLNLCSVLYGQEGAAIPEDASRFHLFLLAGQSNMAGRGKVEPQDAEPHPRVRMLDQAGNWVPAVDPLHFDKQFDQRPWDDHKRRVDAVHQALPSAMPRTGFADSDRLKHRGDMVHFDSASYRELGGRMFKSYLSVTRRGREGVSERAVRGTE
jgi:hypothetical protein